MNVKRLFNLAMVFALTLTALAGVGTPAAQAEGDIEYPAYVPGELVVLFAEGQAADTRAQANALAGSVGAQVAKVAGSAALLRFGEDADVEGLASQLSASAGVRRVEPNYYYRIPEAGMTAGTRPAPSQYVLREMSLTSKKDSSKSLTRQYGVPVAALRAMKGGSGKRTKATYPNDPLLWDNPGWSAVSAEILVGNTTAGKNVCVIDTGVDALHPDLKGRIINGRDFVNDDIIPQDDNGHGTHVSGIIVALPNNKIGIAGAAPTSKVVAVKALDAFGYGTNFDIYNAINYCADRTDVSVINMSLGGPFSWLLEIAVNRATNIKNKIVVASAGNDNKSSYCGYWDDNSTPEEEDDFWVNQGDERSYPAGFAIAADDYRIDDDNDCTTTDGTDLHPAYPNVISVGATGEWMPAPWGGNYYDKYWKASYSNYGEWVTLLAPGTDILSTMPYDKPFILHSKYGFQPRYDYLSGTSMAAPYASAMFARAWGYAGTFVPPLVVNSDIVDYVNYTTEFFNTWSNNWPSEQTSYMPYTNIAAVMQRFAMSGSMVDANTGLPVPKSTMTAYNLITKRAGIPVPAVTYSGENWSAHGEVYTMPDAWAEIVNLPAWQWHEARGMLPGYTAAPTNAFPYLSSAYSGFWSFVGEMGAPPKSANFSVVTAWDDYYFDLDALAFIPDRDDKVLFTKQPENFIVSRWYEGGFIGELDWDGTGALYAFPFARHFGASELSWWNFESITVKNRSVADCDGPVNAALPCYRDEGGDPYEFWVTDWGQFFDDNDNGDEDSGEMPAIAYFDYWNWIDALGFLEVYAWKDGKITYYVTMDDMPAGCNSGEHFWHAFDLSSNGGMLSYTEVNDCTTEANFPYGDLPSWWEPVPIQ
jgi:subtilisin family serine protease